MICPRLARVALPLALVLILAPGLSAQDRARDVRDRMLAAWDPSLLLKAEEAGLYDREALPVLRDMNPFFIRGDFNGDGGMDVAFWVTERDTEVRGVAIIHSTLDTLFVFGAGRDGPAPDGVMPNEGRVDTWHLLPKGHVEQHPYGTVAEIEVSEGTPFTFERETLEFVFLGRSAFVFYWANGRYWMFWTAD